MSSTGLPNQRRIDPLQRLPESLKRLVRDSDTVRRYEAGNVIAGRGVGGEEIRYIVTGEASLVLRDDDGEKIGVDSLGPGDIYGEVGFFTGSPWPSDSELVADEPCVVLEITEDDFGRLLRDAPDFTLPLVRGLARKMMRLHRTIFEAKLKKRALQSVISREEHVFPDYHMGDYVRRRVASRLEELAQSDGPVLMIGENGVGKEGLAHSIFRMSHHCKEVFLLMDLLRQEPEEPSEQLDTGETSREEKERTDKQLRIFFGFEEPARDGGIKETPGYFELARDGTLLVRGIDRLTRIVQLKLLEAVVTGSYRRCGGVRLHKARVRLVGTTRLDQTEMIPERHPLLFALSNERSVFIPPLRTRRKEIPGLVKYYLTKYGQEFRRDLKRPPKETLRALVNYRWPGNDLELATNLKRAVMVSPDGVLRPQDISFDLKRIEGGGKLDLLKFGPVKRVFQSPLYPAVLQSAATPFLFIVMAFLFLGPTDPTKNAAALFSWALGWPILIVGAFVWARFWCTLCPIGVIGNLTKKVYTLDRPFPAFLKNHSDYLIAGAVLFILWFETATDIRSTPAGLGLLLVAMLLSAVVTAVFFERQSWCLYLCGLGGMIAVLSKTSWLELRADRNVCISQCGTNDCYLGSGSREGCPYGQAGPKLQSNRLCKLCGLCVKNCPYGAINLNFRIPGREIWELHHPRTGTAFLVVGMITGLLSEMVGKMPFYKALTADMPVPEVARFTMVFIGLLVGVNILHVAASAISRRVYKNQFAENYARYGLALLPLALSAFMAFHVYYLINLGVQLPILVSQNFDFEIFRKLVITVPPDFTRLAQQALVCAGCIGTMVVMYKSTRVSGAGLGKTLVGALPHAAIAATLTLVILQAINAFFYGT